MSLVDNQLEFPKTRLCGHIKSGRVDQLWEDGGWLFTGM
jgi:hypothetical protein